MHGDEAMPPAFFTVEMRRKGEGAKDTKRVYRRRVHAGGDRVATLKGGVIAAEILEKKERQYHKTY